MKKNVCVLLNILYSLFELSRSQYIMVNHKPNMSNQCDPNNSLVEQFFNIIFTEFHHTPPVCVCVQMCLEKPTYCYPNGCLRKPVRIKEDTTTAYPINLIQYESNIPSKSVMFLVDNDKDLIDQLFEEPRLNSQSERKDKTSSSNFVVRPNPFKELVFKYRKMPKLEMRYNLREKVKNAQSEKIKKNKLDVSKTRWPLNKHLMHGKHFFNSIQYYKKDSDDDQRIFSIPKFSGPESASNAVVNKRLLTKRGDNGGVNIDSLYVYKTDANFSIENLIDDLIINTLDDNNDVTVNTKVHSNESVPTTDTLVDISDTKYAARNDTPINCENVNTTMNIVLINSTNMRLDKNKLHDFNLRDTNSTNNNKTYLEEIANMAEQIDDNNNVSIEFVKRIIGVRYLENETSMENIKNSSVDSEKTNFAPILNFKQEVFRVLNMTTGSNDKEHAVTKRYTAPVLKNIKKKSKQRIIRKLNRKLN